MYVKVDVYVPAACEPETLTMYVAVYVWASLAPVAGVPLPRRLSATEAPVL